VNMFYYSSSVLKIGICPVFATVKLVLNKFAIGLD
jgi:hypothetical protein